MKAENRNLLVKLQKQPLDMFKTLRVGASF